MSPVLIAASLAARVRAHFAAESPEEACGLLSGAEGARGETLVIAGVHPAPNVAPGDRRTAYRVDPHVHLDVQRRLRGTGLGVLGAFHSHPAGPRAPSPRDLAEALPGFLYVIGAPSGSGRFELGAFFLRPDGAAFDERPFVETAEADAFAGIASGRVLDLRGEVCPYTFIRTKLALEDVAVGDDLAVLLDHPPAVESVPRSLRAEGHEVLRVERRGLYAVVVVRRDL